MVQTMRRNQEADMLVSDSSPFKCPSCGERKVDALAWVDDQVLECQTCRARYNPFARYAAGREAAGAALEACPCGETDAGRLVELEDEPGADAGRVQCLTCQGVYLLEAEAA